MTAPAPRREASNGNVDLALPALLSSLRPLRALLAVARHGSTVRAAEDSAAADSVESANPP